MVGLISGIVFVVLRAEGACIKLCFIYLLFQNRCTHWPFLLLCGLYTPVSNFWTCGIVEYYFPI